MPWRAVVALFAWGRRVDDRAACARASERRRRLLANFREFLCPISRISGPLCLGMNAFHVPSSELRHTDAQGAWGYAFVRAAAIVGGGGVLSIGKLTLGQQEYYLGQVAAGLEDYYAGAGEAPGRWLASSLQLGLDGEVDASVVRALLAGLDPSGTYRLTARAHRVAGFDLTFSAPKSVSVLWALGDPGVSLAVRERARARRRSGVWGSWSGMRRSRAAGSAASRRSTTDGFVAAGFRHRLSRNGDPQVHTHVLVANVVLGSDGRWGTLDARHLYAQRIAAGYLYQVQLRHELTRTLGVAWMAPHRGAAEILGVPQRLLRALSSRRAEIEEHLAVAGSSGAAAAQRAAVATRRTKRDMDLDALQARWHQLALEHGFGPEQLRRVLGVGTPLELTRRHAELIIGQLLGPTGLTARDSTFDRAATVRAVAELAPTGLTARQVERFADRLLQHREIVRLESGRFSTRELVAIESRAVATAVARVSERDDAIDKPHVRRVLKRYPSLEDEQKAMVLQLTMAGHGVDVVVAPAGTGKTYALGVARDIWDIAGRRVRGVALSGRAAVELQESARIASSTIASFLDQLDRHPLRGHDVLVVDEAGMVGTRQLATLLEHAAQARAKIVLVGDYHQLPSIDAGGLLRGLAERLPAITLEENRRQREPWEREALDRAPQRRHRPRAARRISTTTASTSPPTPTTPAGRPSKVGWCTRGRGSGRSWSRHATTTSPRSTVSPASS